MKKALKHGKIGTDNAKPYIGMLLVLTAAVSLSSCGLDSVTQTTGSGAAAEDFLQQARALACANYVMNNYQYSRGLEAFLHYLRGGNLESTDFYAERDQHAEREAGAEYLLFYAQLSSEK